jgi:hypothetical protein
MPRDPPKKARSSSAYSLMVLAWSITEVVRYAFYALNLLNLVPQPLTYLRYSTFLALYPLGAGAEAWSSFVTLPSLSTLPGPLGQAVADVERALGRSPAVVARVAKEVFGRALGERPWSTFDLARATLVFIVWPPGTPSAHLRSCSLPPVLHSTTDLSHPAHTPFGSALRHVLVHGLSAAQGPWPGRPGRHPEEAHLSGRVPLAT